MDQDRSPHESNEIADLEGISLADERVGETAGEASARDPDGPGGMRLYAQAMRRHPLLGRASERALALEIEERSRALRNALLSHPATALAVARLTAEKLPAAGAILRRVERAAPAGAARLDRESREMLERAAQRASEKLHAADLDHLVADELVGLVAGAARDPARAPLSLRRTARTRAFARHAAAVGEAARAVADARARFVQANIGLVFHVARRYRSTSLSLADFVQEGMFGLMKAVNRFDHRRGLRFSTYATWWIRHAIGRALSNKSQLVRVPVHMQEARQRLEAIDLELRRELGREPSRDELARAGSVSRRRLERISEVTSSCELRLDAAIGEDEDRLRSEVFMQPGEPASDPGESLDREAEVRALERHIQHLSPMEQDVLRRRFALGDAGREWTLQEIADDVGLSRERIRQIQAGALRKLRAVLAAEDVSEGRAA